MDLAHISQASELLPTRLPPLQIPVKSPRLLGHLHSCLTCYKSGSSHNPLPFIYNNFLETLTELGKALYLRLQFYYKAYNSGITQWKKCIGQCWIRERSKELSYFLLLESRHTTLPKHHQHGSFLNLLVQEFLVEASLYRCHLLTFWWHDWVQFPSSFSLPEVWEVGWKFQSSYHVFCQPLCWSFLWAHHELPC